ncbi:MAG: hypothetical protein NTW87_13275 [Planctomycetota bacterium]|nr:hypothetical protein [Planctomycetota bacterium]
MWKRLYGRSDLSGGWPAAGDLGRYGVVLAAVTDNAEVPVLSWTIEVKPE